MRKCKKQKKNGDLGKDKERIARERGGERKNKCDI